MLLLAIDTATGVVTVALHDGVRVLAQQDVARPREHAEHLAPAIRTVLTIADREPAQVTDVVAGTGPGPFTGLRVGLVTAATFAEAVDARLGGICSLDAIAHEVWLSGTAGPRLLVATDARRKEVYWAGYRLDEAGAHRLDDPQVGPAAQLPSEVTRWPVAGRGPLLYPGAFGPALNILDVSAGVLAHLALQRLHDGAGLDEPHPLYLRRPDATPAAPRRLHTQAGQRARPGTQDSR
ncbi:MAG: tRNA (adenosine(37)-N6)-threonylcarbamoyltransferase complex dimerization subunit type 1 TsaB [Micrococcales bacterium]|nr:tRNA (adenosine(37)-N6)-threonylcarbamoyltransferase complex dimerization subunit type 1 TsaB [Micrococcales bacterium]